MNGGWPLSRQKLAAKSSDVTPIPGIGSLCHDSAFFDQPSRVNAPPIAAPKSAPTAPRTVRVAQSSLAAESNPTSAPRATMPMKMSFRISAVSRAQSVLPPPQSENPSLPMLCPEAEIATRNSAFSPSAPYELREQSLRSQTDFAPASTPTPTPTPQPAPRSSSRSTIAVVLGCSPRSVCPEVQP